MGWAHARVAWPGCRPGLVSGCACWRVASYSSTIGAGFLRSPLAFYPGRIHSLLMTSKETAKMTAPRQLAEALTIARIQGTATD